MLEEQNQIKKKKKIVGNYQLGKIIGTGTFATVREAIHIGTNQKVAIKIMHKRLIADTRDKLNLSREIRILKKLRHPNIVQLLQIIESSHKIYMVMQSVRGGELFETIVNSTNAKLSENQASRYFQQLLNAVQYLQSLGIVHRDIKPENILIASHDIIKLTDFGLANMFHSKERLTTACGSPCYAAPQMISQKQYDPKLVDLWSSGIVLYTMLCGFLPFQHENTAELYKLVQTGNYEEPSHLSADAKDLLKKLMQVNPADRPNIKQIRKHPFCRNYSQPISRGLLPTETLHVDQQLIEEMKILGYSGFIKDIQENVINENTAAFFLLLFKRLQQKNISFLTYFDKIVEIKSPFRSKSFVIKTNHKSNPQQLPQINKKNIISMANLIKASQNENINFARRRVKSNIILHLPISLKIIKNIK